MLHVHRCRSRPPRPNPRPPRPAPDARAPRRAGGPGGQGLRLTGAEIEQETGPGTDRITLYRTLKSFEQSGLIHRVIDDSDVLRYAACSIECSAEAHFDNHVHFKCGVCAHTYCLSQVAIPAVALPGGFRAERRDYLLSGTCQLCQATN